MDAFHKTELERALSEQHYGIVAYRIDHEACTSHAATALVDLLEQRRIRVKLSNRGYEIIEEEPADPSGHDSQTFETLDDLLLALSPMYRERRTEEVMNRLAELAEPSS